MKRLLEGVLGDIRYAVRGLLRTPSFTLTAVATLAIGIGVATTVTAIANQILVQALPYKDGDRLVRIADRGAVSQNKRMTPYEEFLEWRSRTHSFSDVFGAGTAGVNSVRTDGYVTRLDGARVSADGFRILGVQPMLGRVLQADDEKDPAVVVLSYGTWERIFHRDPNVIGRTLELLPSETMLQAVAPRVGPLTIVGVMPDGFQLPTRWGAVDYYELLPSNISQPVSVIARMRPGVSLQAATDEINAIGPAIRPPLRPNAPALTGPRFTVFSLKDEIVGGVRPAFVALLAAVVALLMIVCANLANLLLARATSRTRELAVRSALGADRWRLIRQLMTESLVLALAGGICGGVVAAAGVGLTKRLATINIPGLFGLVFGRSLLPRAAELRVGFPTYAMACGIAFATSLAFGLLPAWRVARVDHVEAMGTRGGGTRRSDAWLRSALVVAQVSIATILLVGAGLLASSFVHLLHTNSGFNPEHVETFQIVLPSEYPNARKASVIDGVLGRLRASPNVEAAGFTRAGILLPEAITVGALVPEGQSVQQVRASSVKPRLRPVSAGYLTAARVIMLAGRDFTEGDASAAPRIVISRTVAKAFFGEGSAIGRTVNWYLPRNGGIAPAEVIGVTDDIRNESPELEPSPDVFVEYHQLLGLSQRWAATEAQMSETAIGFGSIAVRVRSMEAPLPAIEEIVRSVDSNVGLDAVVPMSDLVGGTVAQPKFYAVLAAVFAIIAAALAIIGIYGVLAYAVAQRTREIGVRMALGAQRDTVLRDVVGNGLRLALAGVIIGIMGAAAATRVLRSVLFGVTPLDPATFLGIAALFLATAAIASLAPARRAARVNPVDALRQE